MEYKSNPVGTLSHGCGLSNRIAPYSAERVFFMTKIKYEKENSVPANK